MRRLDAYPVYLIMTFVMGLANATMFTAMAVYYISQVQMSPFQLVLVGTVLEGTILLCEVPTGVVADTYSRRLSVVIGMFIMGAAYLLEGSLPFVAGVLLAEALRGVGETFHSGALDAWLADEVGEERLAAIYTRSGQLGTLAWLLGTGLSVALASLWLALPILVGGVVYLGLGLFLAVCMPETGFHPVPHEGPRRTALAATLRAGVRAVRGNPLLLALVAAQLCIGAAGEGFDRLWEIHLISGVGLPNWLSPVAWFGAISVVSQLVTLVALRLFEARVTAASASDGSATRALTWLQGLWVVATLMFALAGNLPLAIGALLLRSVIGSLIGPLYGAWQARQIDGPVRATVLSLASMTNAFGQTVGGPGVGLLGNRSLRAALLLSGVLFTPLLALYRWAGRRAEEQVKG